jgi:hypothetical protein
MGILDKLKGLVSKTDKKEKTEELNPSTSSENFSNNNDTKNEGEEQEQKTIADYQQGKELSLYQKCNLVLRYMDEKHIGQWSPEETVEKDFTGIIDYYTIRQILPNLLSEGYLEYSRHACSYKITFNGKDFIKKGGYKFK